MHGFLPRRIILPHPQQENPEATKSLLNTKKRCLYCFLLKYERWENPLAHKFQPDQKSHSHGTGLCLPGALLTCGVHLLHGKWGHLATAALGALAHPLADQQVLQWDVSVNGSKTALVRTSEFSENQQFYPLSVRCWGFFFLLLFFVCLFSSFMEIFYFFF